MLKFNRAVVVVVLSLIAGMFTFLVPSVSYAHPLSHQSGSKPLIATYKVTLGQKIVIPSKNGISIHLETSFIPANSNGTISSHAVTPHNGYIPIFGCGYAVGRANYVNIIGAVLMTYSMSDFFCNNGLGITVQNPPTGGGNAILGISLTSHSENKGWIQRPWSAYAVGFYDFTIGISTPWVTIGSNCSGNIQLNLLGDGPFMEYHTGCIN